MRNMDNIGNLYGKTVRARERDGRLEITDGETVSVISHPWLASAVMRTFRATGDGSMGDLNFERAPAPTIAAQIAAPPPAAIEPPPPVVAMSPDRADHPGQPPTSHTDWEAVISAAAANQPAAAPPLPIEGETIESYAGRVLTDTGVTLASAIKADEGFARMLLDTMRTRALDDTWGAFLRALAAHTGAGDTSPPSPAGDSSPAVPS